jgi:hypothetical protein
VLIHRPNTWAILMLCLLAASACGTDRSTGPNVDARLDAERLTADVAAAERAMQPPVLASFTALSARFDLGPVATAAIATSQELVAGSPLEGGHNRTLAHSKQLALSTAERLMAAAVSDVSLASPALPPGSLGTTYVYDPVLERYVAAPGRTGAPANGVRFILYAVNPITHEPIVSVEVGHADLLDEGATRPTGLGLRLIVVSEGTTYLDYRVGIDGSMNAGTLAVEGFVTDGETRLDFDIAASGTAGPTGATMNVAFEFEVPSRAFRVVGSVEGTHAPGSNRGRINLVVHSGLTTIGVEVTGDDQTVNATILVNDEIFATVTGDHHNPIIRGAGGRELTPQEVEAVQGIFRLVGGVFELFANLLTPVAAILVLSAIP